MKNKLLTLLLFSAATASAADWASWRGPEQTGVSRETGLPEKWSLKKGDPAFVFGVEHSGLSSPVVLGGKVYVVGRCGDKETQQEVIQAFDAKTGKLAWEDKINVWHTDIVDDRLGFTNVVGDPETGNVYAHTTAGELIGYTADGKRLWSRSLTEEFGRVSGYGGRVVSPIVDEDKVIVGMPNASWGELTVGNTRLVAFDKKTGQIVWWASGNHRVTNTYYSTPVVAVVGGQRLVFTGGGDGCLHAFKVRTGEKVWSHEFVDNHEAVNCTPVIKGDKIWVGHGEENAANNQGRVVCIDGAKVKDGKPTELWRYDGVKVKFASPVLHEGLLYVCDEAGKLFCFDADKGGAPLWEFAYGVSTKGSPIWADGKIYISEVDSLFHILKPTKEGCTSLSSVRFRGKAGVKTELHGTPAISDGRIYFTTTNQLVCIGNKDSGPVKVELPPEVKEPEGKGPATHIQVVPADATLKPGEGVEFKAYAYDANGRKVGEAEAAWEPAGIRPPVYPIGLVAPKAVAGPAPPPVAGKLSQANGKATTFTAAEMPPAQFGRVVAKVGKLAGEARVRVVPVLPYALDFEKVPVGRTPGAWVNTAGKFAVVMGPDGTLALRKRNDSSNPLVARANAYIGAPDLKDYAVQADVYTSKVRGNMADLGVGASRYTLLLAGNDQVLRLNTWDALYGGRVKTEAAFKWEPGTWYTMKVTASVKDGKGVIKGKVWPRGQAEPEKWTLELEDPLPNDGGAPLVYAFANGTIDDKNPGPESFFDNVKVTPNEKK
ncbi:MAG: PQQ-binding-like beta-propeller repeat protein [Gemmataceae bacterium]